MSMEAAVDIDSGDYSLHSNHSGAASRSGSGYSRATGITGVDVESGEAASLVGGKGHRSIYAALAEEALLGAASPSDPEGTFGRSHVVEIAPSEFQDATGATWRMGSAGAFWRLDGSSAGGSSGSAAVTPLSLSARCCITSPDQGTTGRRTSWKGASAGTAVVMAVVSLLIAAAGWNAWNRMPAKDDSAPLAPSLAAGSKGACCTAATAACFACRAGTTVEEFCSSKGAARGILGCEASGAHIEDKGCCVQALAPCLSCQAGLSVDLYCAHPGHANVTGCGDSNCGLVERDLEYAGGDLYSVGSISSSEACCDICREEAKCTSWTWGGSAPGSAFRERCFLKRQVELSARPARGYVSGLPGRDVTSFQIKLKHGLCLAMEGGDLELQACHTTDEASQRFLLVRGLHRIAAADGSCLEGAPHRDGKLSLRPCDSSRGGQRWTLDSSSGHLRTSDGGDSEPLCVHAPHRTREGGQVVMQFCREASEEQGWSLWSSALLGREATAEAMAEEALRAPTTTTITSTSQVVARLPTLFCFSVMVSWNYEPELVRMQNDGKRSIFQCEGFAVYSNKMIDLGNNVWSRVVQGTDLKCRKGGEFNTLLNTPVFQKVWEQVLNDRLYDNYEWTAKVDCDAVFFPPRLRKLVQGPALEGAQGGNGAFINNCGFGLHGPIEVVSRRALNTYKEAWHHCDNPPQEDVYLQACMNKLGVTQVNQFDLLSEEACRTPDWQACQSSHVAFHPFKELEDYQECEDRALATEKTE
mmetsp:Transcript_64425/g.185120  ORF Transcript_64425/g.185120 Transcript_64425/m.185120 type:complete len:757 (-) Transcript_64425:55-2325(-)